MEGESPLLKEGGNAAKPLLTRFCVAKSVISPSKPPSLTENFPTEPRCYRSEICFAFCDCGVLWESFFVAWGDTDFLQGAAIALFLWVGNIYETHSTNQSGAKPHRQKSTSRQKQKLPPRAPAKAKRNKLSQCSGGCSWGKFGEDEGGLEGEGTPSERGSLLPPRSSSPYPSLLQKKP